MAVEHAAMTDLIPDVGALAEQILDETRRDQSVVYVEGGVGSGRGELVRRLGALDDRTRALEFLQLSHADATSTAYLECAALLPPGDRPSLGNGSDVELFQAARKVFRALGDLGAVPVLRVPESWQRATRAVIDDDAGARRAKALLDALLQSGCGAVVVADDALSAASLGIHRGHHLPPHEVPLDTLSQVEWGAYQIAFDALLRAAPTTERASPFAWRLAVGAVALGANPPEVLASLRMRPVLPTITRVLAERLTRTDIAPAVAWLLALRRPVPRAEVATASGVAASHHPLLTECIGYGHDLVRVAPFVRTLLSEALRSAGRATHAQHDALSARYELLDGAADPTALDASALQAWCEKVHHAAHGGPDSLARWQRQRLPSPELYWDRARRLSIEEGDFRSAAEVYRRCVEAFPEDDYGWHYLAFNLQKAMGKREEVEAAYRRAVALSPENPWWNSRLVTFLIEDAQPGAAQREWREAVARVDADGSQLRRSPWLADSFCYWVAEAWHRAGRTHRAAMLMDSIPAPVVRRARRKLRRFAEQVGRQDPARGTESLRWRSFLRGLEKRTGASPDLAAQARALWSALRAMGGAELPEPMADVTADGERFQFAWSFATVYVEVEVDEGGGILWFGRDRETGVYEGAEEPIHALPDALRPWLARVIDA